MSGTVTEILKGVGVFTLLFVPIHQALVEIFKLLGTKTTEYFEALKYIVYGQETQNGQADSEGGFKFWLWNRWFTELGLTPRNLPKPIREQWIAGPQKRLIESFLLRSLGDNPVSEISDSDIQNVVRISRQAAKEEVRKTIETLESLLVKRTTDPKKTANILNLIEPKGAMVDDIKKWIEQLQKLDSNGGTVEVLLETWRRSTIERHLSGELRARNELANALKSAEFRYHRVLFKTSTFLAVLESIAICFLTGVTNESGLLVSAVFLISFGGLILAPQGTKSLLDAITGIGSRFKV